MKLTKRISRFFGDFITMMRTRRFWVSAMVSLLFLFATLGLIWWRIVPLSTVSPFIPLHYNIYLGIDRFGPWQEVFWVPAIGFILWVLNLGLQTWVFPREKVFATLLAVSTAIFSALLCLAMSLIVLLNLSYAA